MKEGIELIKKFEGLSLKVYRDPIGLNTIGYGHLILPNEKFTTITEEYAEELLKKDLALTMRSIRRMTTICLTDNQLGAILSYVFNLGAGCYQRSTLRRVINRREFIHVPNQLMRYVYAGGRPIKGLINRRAAECYLWNSNRVDRDL